MVKRMASMNARLNIKKLDRNIVQKHGGSKQVGLKQLGSKQVGFKQLGVKQVGFKQLGHGVETRVHGVYDEKHVWFEVELQGAQGDREAERSTQQCMKSEVAKHLGVVWIYQQNGLFYETNVTLFAKPIYMLRFFSWLASIEQGMLEPVKVKCIFLGYHKSIVGNKLWRLDDVTSKVVLYRNVGFNESREYKKNFIGPGVGAGSMQVLHGFEFEVKQLGDHTFEVEPQENVNQEAGLQEVQNQDLIDYQLARDREQHLACELFGCKAEIWVTKGFLFKAKGNILGLEIIRDQSGNTLRVPQLMIHNKKLVQTLLKEHSMLSLEGSLSGDCDVKENGYGLMILGCAGSLKVNLQHMKALSTTEAGYMTFTEAWKKEIWLKGLLTESRYELRLVAGIATGALVKGCSWSRLELFDIVILFVDLLSHHLLKVMAAPVISISSDLSDESVGSSILRVILIDDSGSDTKIPKRHVSSTLHDAMLARWWSRVASRSSSPITSTLEFPNAPIPPSPSTIVTPSTEIISPVDAPPGVRRRRAILIQPSRMYTSHHLDRFTSVLSSDHSSSDHSSSDHSSSRHSTLDHSSSEHSTSDHSSYRHSASGHYSSGHTPLVITIADSSTPSRFVYPPLARTSQYSEAYHHWRSPTATMTSSIPALGALVPSRADLLPPRKRLRDSISPEVSIEDFIDADVFADIEADAMVVEVAADMDVEAEVDAGIGIEVDGGIDVEEEVEGDVEFSDRGTMKVGMDVVAEIDIPDGMLMPDAVERLEQVKEVVQDIYEHVIETPLQRVEDIESGQRELEARSLIASGERELIMTITRSGMTPKAIKELINQRVAEANVGGNGNRNGGGNGDGNDRGNGNRNGGGNGNGNPKLNDRVAMPVAQRYQAKYATCIDLVECIQENIRADAAFAMSWRELMKLMTKVYKHGFVVGLVVNGD
nr:zinc finger, CCHC-type [Tanacetum cinerariifolium]